jgi:hypothetical protein
MAVRITMLVSNRVGAAAKSRAPKIDHMPKLIPPPTP